MFSFLESIIDTLQEFSHNHQRNSGIEDMKNLPSKVLHLVHAGDTWFKYTSSICITTLPTSPTSVVKDLEDIPCLLNGVIKELCTLCSTFQAVK